MRYSIMQKLSRKLNRKISFPSVIKVARWHLVFLCNCNQF